LSYFDTDSDGHINFDEFLIGVRVSASPTFLFDILNDLSFRAK